MKTSTDIPADSLFQIITLVDLATVPPISTTKVRRTDTVLGTLSDDSRKLFYLYQQTYKAVIERTRELEKRRSNHKKKYHKKGGFGCLGKGQHTCATFQTEMDRDLNQLDGGRAYANALHNIFWLTVRIQFPALLTSNDTIAIRKDNKVVTIKAKSNTHRTIRFNLDDSVGSLLAALLGLDRI